jgi:hypothetical protein
MRNEVPEIVGRTIMRTVLPLRAGAVSRTLWDTVHAENHCGLPCATAFVAGRKIKISAASSVTMHDVRASQDRPFRARANEVA